MKRAFLALVLGAMAILPSACAGHSQTVQDEAKAAGREPASFVAGDEDYFHAMDGGIALTPDEVKGRDTWIVWSGGNDRFWDRLSTVSFGNLDLLKIVSSYPALATKTCGTSRGA